MCFAVAFVLGDFEETFETHAPFRIVPVDRFSRDCFHGEHLSPARVRIVRDRHHAPAGLLFVVGEVLPQVFRVEAVERAVRNNLRGTLRTVGKDNVSMAIVSVWNRGPLETDKRSKHARVVVALRIRDHVLPDRSLKRLVVDDVFVVEHRKHKLFKNLAVLLVLAKLVPALARLGRSREFVTLIEPGHHAHVFRMIAQQKEIERASQPHLHSVVCLNLFTARETECVVGCHLGIARVAGVDRPTGMHMGVAPEKLAWNLFARVGGIGGFARNPRLRAK